MTKMTILRKEDVVIEQIVWEKIKKDMLYKSATPMKLNKEI
jgi:hypothetical protein